MTMVTETAVTIYNRFTDPKTDNTVYYRTIIPAAHWENDKATSSSKTSHSATGKNRVWIPKDQLWRVGKNYVPPDEFDSLSDDLRKECWTIRCDDSFIEGSCYDDIPPKGYGRFAAEHHVLMVGEVKDYNFGSPCMQHFEVFAK